jgi:hypothetical protein
MIYKQEYQSRDELEYSIQHFSSEEPFLLCRSAQRKSIDDVVDAFTGSDSSSICRRHAVVRGYDA